MLLLWETKLIALVGLLAAMLFATLLPLCLHRLFTKEGSQGSVVISYLSVFGGGVFLGIYLLILAPEVQLLLQVSLVERFHLTYPVPEVMIASGFFLMVIIAKLMHWVESRQTSPGPGYMLLLVALSFTNVLEGLSIGFQRTKQGVWNMCLAILIMDSVVSFCMGLQMITHTGYEQDHLLQKVKHKEEEPGESSELKDPDQASYGTGDDKEKLTEGSGGQRTSTVVISALVYSAMTSLGILTGTIVLETFEESPGLNLANGILQSIAAGTFLYTTFFEILFGEIDSSSPVSKLMMLFLGFGMIALLTIKDEELIHEAVEELNITLSSTTSVPLPP